ncbi:hypothetical protein [Nafulsella turpanensis]|uniref:hypothetical protein n=1 Tax=Nafulsella turpanensis TaxID=1265690 RepID=UPI00034C7A59|nr:hypothetical protein [Nafulsella turpanensis]
MKSDDHLEAVVLLQKHLQVQKGEPLAIAPAAGLAGVEELRALLQQQINFLLDHQFERLLQAMYRMDVSEDAFKEALALSTGPAIVSKLTDLVLEREMQKVATRRLYSASKMSSI